MNHKQIIWVSAFAFSLLVTLIVLLFQINKKYTLKKSGVKTIAMVVETTNFGDGSYYYELMYPIDDNDTIQNTLPSTKVFKLGEEIIIYYDRNDIWSIMLGSEFESLNTVYVLVTVVLVLSLFIYIGICRQDIVKMFKTDTLFTND